MLAETNLAGIILLALGAIVVIVSIGAIVARGRARGKGPEIPHGMRPGPSDAALEAPLLYRYQGWGVLLVAFFVIWFPLQWLVEPDRNLAQEGSSRRSRSTAGSGRCTPSRRRTNWAWDARTAMAPS
jgi:hypothetical protein